MLHPSKERFARVVISNPRGCSCAVDTGTELGEASHIKRVETSDIPWRKRKVRQLVSDPELLTMEQNKALHTFLGDHHEAFCLEEHKRETKMVAMEIHTGDARPLRQPVRRMPFAVRQEIAKHLNMQNMRKAGVIQPSSSPWASPVGMVRKRDRTHQFCVNYRGLNKVIKPDTFPLTRIDVLLDQLSASQYFSTLDLASGYWQIQMHLESIEKTAFVTPHDLHEFRVMPFGLTNTPGVFQQLIESLGLTKSGGRA